MDSHQGLRLRLTNPGAVWRSRLLAGLVAVAGFPAYSQAIERNLPPAQRGQPTAPALPAPPSPETDATPIGPSLKGLVLLGPTEAATLAVVGVRTEGATRVDDPEMRRRLARYLGRSLSRKLISEIQAEIVSAYRRKGFPFVSVTAPEQEISAGVLRIRVIEFHAGAIRIEGARHPDRLRADIRLQPGDPVSADALSQDLDWLNRYPFSHVEPVLTPGTGFGETDLVLKASETRPFHLYAGYANSGSSGSTWDRYFLGASIGGLLVPRSLVSYQFTASPDFFERDGHTLYFTEHARYLSHGARFSVPLGARQALEGSLDLLETNSVTEPFAARQKIKELTLGWRSAISNYLPMPGDLTFGVEAKRLDRTTFFGGEDVLDQAAEVYMLYLGGSHGWGDPFGRSEVSVLAHYSPGGVDDRNGSDNFATYSKGRVSRADYGYVGLTGSRTLVLPAGWWLSSALTAQYAWLPLPETEQTGLGGQALVRGYALEDGSFDSGAVLRTELHAPPTPMFRRWTDQAGPMIFLDAGHGSTRRVPGKVDAVSAGVGMDYQLGRGLSANLDYAVALRSAPFTRCGDSRLEVRLTAGF
jgi:hemolysin activation/secretion protein